MKWSRRRDGGKTEEKQPEQNRRSKRSRRSAGKRSYYPTDETQAGVKSAAGRYFHIFFGHKTHFWYENRFQINFK